MHFMMLARDMAVLCYVSNVCKGSVWRADGRIMVLRTWWRRKAAMEVFKLVDSILKVLNFCRVSCTAIVIRANPTQT